LPWMAPELFKNQSPDAASDIYSLGLVLWEIVSRRRPFAHAMPAAIVGMVLAGEREQIADAWPLVFKRLIPACWNADPLQRPSAEKIGDEFKAALRQLRSILELKAEAPELKEIQRENQLVQPAHPARVSLLKRLCLFLLVVTALLTGSFWVSPLLASSPNSPSFLLEPPNRNQSVVDTHLTEKLELPLELPEEVEIKPKNERSDTGRHAEGNGCTVFRNSHDAMTLRKKNKILVLMRGFGSL